MKLKLSFKHIIVAISSAIIFFIVVFFILLSLLNKKPVAAFYGIPENTKDGIISVLQTTHIRRNKKSLPYEIIVLDNSLSLKESLKKSKKVDLLFINKSLNSEYATSIAEKKDYGFDNSFLSGMTTSIKKMAPSYKNKISGVPLLIDHYEIDVNTDSFKKSKIPSITFWQDIELLAKKTKNSNISPILFAANDDETLINTIGALVESLSGFLTWNSFVNKIIQFNQQDSTSNYSELLNQMIQKDGELFDTISLIRKWHDLGLFPKDIGYIKFNDINAYMDANLTTITFMKLSEHRTINYKIISKFSSIFYPYSKIEAERHFTAPIILAISLSKNKIVNNSVQKLSNSLQTNLSTATGLAPVLANCNTPDKQADDVRFWIAASEVPLQSVSDAAFLTQKQKKLFAKTLRNLLVE